MRLGPIQLCLLLTASLGGATALLACGSDPGKPSSVGEDAGRVGVGEGGRSVDSGPPEDAARPDGGAVGTNKPLAVDCNANEECDSGVCFVGGRQAFCSLSCTTVNATTVCVPPLTGSCNNQGKCKRD